MYNLKFPINFRDLGGISAAEGRLADCRILRSGEVCGLSEEDKEVLRQHFNLKNIIDFRSLGEVMKSPDDEIPGAAYHHIEIMKNSGGLNTSANVLTSIQTVSQSEAFMKQMYKLAITSSEATNGYRRFIQILLDTSQGSSLFHCFAGKDRTGVGAAIILTILGVSRDDIMHDYLETNRLSAKSVEGFLQTATVQGVQSEALEAMRSAMSAQPEFLNNAYAVAEEQYGSFENYIEQGLQISPEQVRSLREMYLI